MRFKSQRSRDSIPEVNLVPMMDVLMSVLTFFIIMSITFTGQRLSNITLPHANAIGEDKSEQILENSLIIGLSKEGKILINKQTVSEAELRQQMQSYLSENSSGTILIKADRNLSYQQVSQLLKKMGKVGGDKVFLALDQK